MKKTIILTLILAKLHCYGGTHQTVGKASYYWQPQGTASGERFNPKHMTAAHKTLPLGSFVRVTNKLNNKSCVVRINDRGPYVRGRIIDLSKRAAHTIEMTVRGVVPVEIKVLNYKDIVHDIARNISRRISELSSICANWKSKICVKASFWNTSEASE